MRRDLADFFSTLVEGVKGKRAVEWRLVDAVYPTSQFKDAVAERARGAGGDVGSAGERPGHHAESAEPDGHRRGADVLGGVADDQSRQADRRADGRRRRPAPQPSTPEAILEAGDQFWPLRAFRELDDALLRLRVNEPEIGTDRRPHRRRSRRGARASTRRSLAHQAHWLVREIIHFMKRTLKRIDLTSRSFFAFIEPGIGVCRLAVRAGARRRSLVHARTTPTSENAIALSPMNGGPLPMSNGLTRLQTRFLGEPDEVGEAARARRPVQRRRTPRSRAW